MRTVPLASCTLAALLAGPLLAWSPAPASMLYAPHDAAHGIGCTNCHQYPLDAWPGYVPNPGDPDDTVRNFLCLRCHDGSADGPGEVAAPAKLTHSSANLSANHGTWSIQCVDCHDPHFQAQVQYYQSDTSSLYLVTGSYQGVSVDTSTTPVTSTITYSRQSAASGWSDPATWPAKTGAGRGLILVADVTNPYDTFEVVAADAATITVAGDLSQVAAGPNFGLIYGQLIRDQLRFPATLNSGSAPVKFFDPYGGFTDTTNATPEGICQVCHTLALHWRHDGTLTDHNPNSRCTNCHKTAEGFKPSVPDHTWLLKSGTICETCHDPNGTADVLAGIHQGACADCHNLPDYASLRTGVNGDATLHGPVGQGNTSACTVCHDPAIYPTATFHHATTNAQNGNCTFCHSGNATPDHTTMVAGDANCTHCHGANVGSASGAPVDPADPKVHDACTTCHKTDGSLKAVTDLSRGIVIAMPAGGGDCSACHGEYFDNHQAIDHTTRVADTANCNSCHTNTAGTTTTVPTSTTDNKVHDSCFVCHDTNGTLRAAYGKAIAITPGDCNNCHGAYFPSHQNADHTAKVAGVTPCTDCHTTTAGTATGVPTSTTDNEVHDSCATCHDTTTGLLLSQAAANVNGYLTYGTAMAAGSCGTCHGDYFDHHVHGTSTGYVSHDVAFDSTLDLGQANAQPCSSCHNDAGLASPLSTWDAVVTEHGTVGGVPQASACATCHFYATNGNQSGEPDTPPLATVQSTIATGTGVHCLTCHTPKAAPATHGGHQDTDFGWAGTCIDCHDTDGDPTTLPAVVSVIHGNTCATCHVSPATGDYTRKAGDPANGVDGDARLVDGVTWTRANATCLTCHPASTYPTPAIHHDQTAHDYAANGQCTHCHQADVGQPGTSRANGNLAMPANLACNWCHLAWPQNGYATDAQGRVQVFSLTFDPNTNPGQGVTNITALTSHAISRNLTTPIADYSACFACHGATSYSGSQGVAPQVRPFHGLGTPYTGDHPSTSGHGGCVPDQDVLYQYAFANGTCGSRSDPHTEADAIHPGFGFLYGLSDYVRLPTGPDAYYDGPDVNRTKAHFGDKNGHTLLSGSKVTGTFQIPWDGFAATETTAPVVMDLDVGENGVVPVTVKVPLVDLSQ